MTFRIWLATLKKDFYCSYSCYSCLVLTEFFIITCQMRLFKFLFWCRSVTQYWRRKEILLIFNFILLPCRNWLDIMYSVADVIQVFVWDILPSQTSSIILAILKDSKFSWITRIFFSIILWDCYVLWDEALCFIF